MDPNDNGDNSRPYYSTPGESCMNKSGYWVYYDDNFNLPKYTYNNIDFVYGDLIQLIAVIWKAIPLISLSLKHHLGVIYLKLFVIFSCLFCVHQYYS